MTSRFKGKIALVTGGGSGLGEAIAGRLIADGATVIVADVSGKQDEVAESLGDRAVARHLDVSDESSVRELEQWISDTHGGLDILANNAGIGGPHTTARYGITSPCRSSTADRAPDPGPSG